MPDGGTLRIDKLLWHLRFAKSRTLAQSWVAAGHMRVNGNRVEHTHIAISVGDIITFARDEDIVAVRIDKIPLRRGPAPEAQKCYSFLTARKSG
jgi:ribosome-associated heat shock protein Hsp15